MLMLIGLLLFVLALMLVFTAEVMRLPFLSALVAAGVVAIYWKTPDPVSSRKKYQALAMGVLISQLVVLPFAWEIAKRNLFGSATERNVQHNTQHDAPKNSEEIAPQTTETPSVEALARGPAQALDEFCKTYCADELGWSAQEFTKSSVQDFFQTSESTDLRCDFTEVAKDIGGDERHTGSWINEQCSARNLRTCYWSINYGKPYGGRVACIRPAFVPG